MLAAVYLTELQELEEEEIRREAELDEVNARMAYQLREAWLERQLDEVNWAHPYSINHDIRTGDAALDEDYCSDMDDCLIPCEETEVDTTDVFTEVSDDEALASIDWTEEINLNDLYYNEQ